MGITEYSTTEISVASFYNCFLKRFAENITLNDICSRYVNLTTPHAKCTNLTTSVQFPFSIKIQIL